MPKYLEQWKIKWKESGGEMETGFIEGLYAGFYNKIVW